MLRGRSLPAAPAATRSGLTHEPWCALELSQVSVSHTSIQPITEDTLTPWTPDDKRLIVNCRWLVRRRMQIHPHPHGIHKAPFDPQWMPRANVVQNVDILLQNAYLLIQMTGAGLESSQELPTTEPAAQEEPFPRQTVHQKSLGRAAIRGVTSSPGRCRIFITVRYHGSVMAMCRR